MIYFTRLLWSSVCQCLWCIIYCQRHKQSRPEDAEHITCILISTKPLFHLEQTLSFSFTSIIVFYSVIITFNKPICMFGAMKSAPNYQLSVTGEAQGKATRFVMQRWQKALLVLRTFCKTLAIGGPVSIFNKVLLMSEGPLLGWEYALHRCLKSSRINICEEKAEQSPDIAHPSLLMLHRVNVSEKRHIKRSTFSINLGENTGLFLIFFLLETLVYQAPLFLL